MNDRISARGTMDEYLVEVLYREPGYEARTGPRDEPFRFRYRIAATSAGQAEGMARHEFQRISSMSSVGWVREIVRVVVERVLAAT